LYLHLCEERMEAKNTFPKTESLKHKRLFDSLFKGGKRAFQHPLMLVWKECELPSETPLQIGFSVPKKHFKRAADRNLVKRRLRESYRLQKHDLHLALNKKGKQIAVLIVVVKADNTSYEVLRDKMMLLLRSVEAKINDVQ